MTSEPEERMKRFGVVAVDPLRLLGLETMFAADGVELVRITGQGALKAAQLELIFVDATGTEHLFDLLSAMQRSRPRLKVIVIGLEPGHDYVQRDGSVWAPRKVMARLLEAGRKAEAEAATAPLRFTPREEDVLRLLVGGQSNREIGKALDIDEATVKAHVGRLLRKVGVENRTALTVTAMQRGLLEENTPVLIK